MEELQYGRRHGGEGAELRGGRVGSPVLAAGHGGGLDAVRAASLPDDSIVMHPGPINRGVEIDSSVADGSHSVILPQVTFGIAVRMAVMSIVAGNEA